MLLALIKKELLALMRDVHGLAALFLMPAVFIIIMSLALKDVYDPPVKMLPYAIENRDSGKLADTLIAEWEKNHGKAEGSEDWSGSVKSGKLSYALVIEKGFSGALMDDKMDSQTRLRLVTDPGLESGIFAANKAELVMIASEMRARALLIASHMATGVPRGRSATTPAVGEEPSVSAQGIVEAERLAAGARPSAVQQNVPAWLVFGMFFVVASLSNLFLQERQCGALARLASLGVPVSMMIWSKALPYLAINGLQAALMLAVGVWLMPVLGGDALSLAGINWGALLFILLAVSTAAIGLALALASLVRTQAQAATMGPVVNILMAAIGGVMVPKFVMPEAMQRVAEFSPMNWGLEGMLAVLLRGSDMGDVLLPSAKLMGFAMLMMAIAVLLFRRRVS